MTSRTANRWAAEIAGRRVTLMGLGRHGGGLGAAKFLATAGARLTISDTASADSLRESLSQLSRFPQIHYHFGEHLPEDFTGAEIVVVNPAVPASHSCLEMARASGARITSEIELVLERCPARIIGVSGTNGKSTTATMLWEILLRAGRRTWLGGNIGGSLLTVLEELSDLDWVVLEISSFQLAHLGAQVSLPEMAVLTNCSPNHLDWHGDFEAYAAAKRRLLNCAQVVLNGHDPVVSKWMGASQSIPMANLDDVPRLRVPGIHNRQNAACAMAAARAAGVEDDCIRQALADFRGLQHRIEWIGEFAGRHFYNDSKSTSPAATISAVAAMERPTWVLLGGVAKGTAFSELAGQIAKRICGAAVYGQAGEQVAKALRTESPTLSVEVCETLAEAFAVCVARSRSGDAILLSPACASFDQYCDFSARGDHFRQLVQAAA